jgi:membrane protein implicated in regulation of membrane protease activity
MPDYPFPESDSPQDVHWVDESADQPTYPEGAWTQKTAQVEAPLAGYKYQVKFEGVYWTAIALPVDQLLTAGEIVTVVGREGTELVVQKLVDHSSQPHELNPVI